MVFALADRGLGVEQVSLYCCNFINNLSLGQTTWIL